MLPGALLSTVDLAEVVSTLAERGMPAAPAHADVLALFAAVVAFDAELALDTAALRPLTRTAGLCRNDRCCLALAGSRDGAAPSTQTRWEPIARARGGAIRDIGPRRS